MTETTTPKVGPATKLGADHAQSLMPRAGILIGYARCSTEKQDLTAQRQILTELGVAEERVYLDHGLTGRNRSRQRPGRPAGRRHSRRSQARPSGALRA
jgi:hypothetical protein